MTLAEWQQIAAGYQIRLSPIAAPDGEDRLIAMGDVSQLDDLIAALQEHRPVGVRVVRWEDTDGTTGRVIRGIRAISWEVFTAAPPAPKFDFDAYNYGVRK